MFFNQTDKNPKLLPLLTNHDFREALSLAHRSRRDQRDRLPRPEQAVADQPAAETDKFYNKQLATQYLDA